MILTILYFPALAATAGGADAPFHLSQLQGNNIKHLSPTYTPQGELPPLSAKPLAKWLQQLQPFDVPAAFHGRFVQTFQVINDTNETRWYIHPKGATIQYIDIAVIIDNDVSWYYTGFLRTENQQLHYGATTVIPSQEQATIAIFFDSDYYLAEYDITLYPEPIATQTMQAEATVIIMCLGICLALGLYNLFLYLGSKEKAYLFYSISTLSFALGWANVLGFWQIFSFQPVEFLLLPPFLVGAALSMYFARTFLNLSQLSPKIDLLLLASAWLSLVLLPVSALFPSFGFYLVTLTTSVSLISGLIAGIYCWRQGYRPARYFVLAFVAVALPNLIGNVLNLGVFETAPVNTYLYALLGLTLDSLLLAFALADKLRLVTQSHNQLAASLEQQVSLRTEALAQANTAMEHLIDELQSANNAKSHFLANMSHEIRTPLTSIIGYTESILLGDVEETQQKRILNVIAENSQHLLHIINDILDISKIEADKLEFEQVPTSLQKVYAQVEKLMTSLAREKNLVLNFEHHFPQPSMVSSDPTRLRQILFNVINNAIKFTNEGSISVTTKYQNEQLFIVVKDSGIGMDNRTMQNIFNPFSQGESTTTRKFGGTGLGLSISRRLAQGLGGDIGVQSVLGLGSTFTINVHAPATLCSIELESFVDLPIPVGPPTEQSLPSLAGNRVLLVDDNPHNLDLITLILKRMHLFVDTAVNGEQALEKVFANEYQLILMDIQMPGMSGIEATEKIRKCGYSLPIIALTANNMTHEIAAYMQKGFTNHLAKPIVRHKFIRTLELYLTPQGSNESLLSADDMLPIIADYYRSLTGDLQQFETAWQQQDLHEVQEIAHRIKGAAGSFGFAAIGDKFASVEETLKNQTSNHLADDVENAIDFTNRCLHLPGVNVPLAVCHHEQDVALFLSSLEELLTQVPDDIEEIQKTANCANASIAIMHINRLSKRIQRCCWEAMQAQLEQLKTLLKNDPDNSTEIEQFLTTIKNMVHNLNSTLA
ncbi:MAG: 7TM diverse intracellular signaling domain-containing protein [Aestuariibacter sp.]